MFREVLPWTTVSAYSAFIPNQKGLICFNIRNSFYNISPYIYFASECHIEETHGGANTKLYDSAGKAANLFFVQITFVTLAMYNWKRKNLVMEKIVGFP